MKEKRGRRSRLIADELAEAVATIGFDPGQELGDALLELAIMPSGKSVSVRDWVITTMKILKSDPPTPDEVEHLVRMARDLASAGGYRPGPSELRAALSSIRVAAGTLADARTRLAEEEVRAAAVNEAEAALPDGLSKLRRSFRQAVAAQELAEASGGNLDERLVKISRVTAGGNPIETWQPAAIGQFGEDLAVEVRWAALTLGDAAADAVRVLLDNEKREDERRRRGHLTRSLSAADDVARWKRVLENATWPEPARKAAAKAKIQR